LVTEEQGIFDQIDTIMDSESQYLEQLNELINLVDNADISSRLSNDTTANKLAYSSD
jgi:hypothetical protein